MKKLILCVAFSLMVTNPCVADDPNNPLIDNHNYFETRIKELEDKIIELENRIAELESQRPPLPARSPGLTPSASSGLTSPPKNDPDKDSLRVERCAKAVHESLAVVGLYEIQLKTLPICYHLPIPDINEIRNFPHYYYYYYYYGRIRYHFMSLDSELNWALDNIELLDGIEKEYKAIKNYAQRNPELNIDRNDISTKLIVLRSEWVGFDKIRDDIRNSMEKGHRFMRTRCYETISKREIRAAGIND
jgi:hypothetical protein